MTAFELRVALTAEDYDRLVTFYRDGLGLEPGDTWTHHGRGQLFHSGKAVIEILDKEHAAHVDSIEAGKPVSGPIRFTFQVPDIHVAIENALKYGAKLVHEPIFTPWNPFRARIEFEPIMQGTTITFRLLTGVFDFVGTPGLTGAVPSSVLDGDLAAFDFHHQHTIIRVGDEKINFANGAQRASEPLDRVQDSKWFWQILEGFAESKFGVARRVVGAGATMHLAAIEPLQIADGDLLRASIEFANPQRGNAKLVLRAVGVMLTFLDKARLAEMHIAPGHPADQRELIAGHLLGFVLADAEVLCQLIGYLPAIERLTIAEQVQEGEQEVVL